MKFGRWNKHKQAEPQPLADEAQVGRLESVAGRVFNIIQRSGTRDFPGLGLVGEFNNGLATVAPNKHGASWAELDIFRASTGEWHILEVNHLAGTESEHLAGSLTTATDITLKPGVPVQTTVEQTTPMSESVIAPVEVGAPMDVDTCEELYTSLQRILDAAGGIAVGSASVRTA